MPKKHTVVAIAYDFDGTLAEGNIQENSFIPNLGVKKDDFWRQVKQLAKEHDMDEILAYMYLLIDKARSGSVKVDKNSIREHGKSVRYFVGVEDFFLRMNEYAKEHQINLKHYIISSGTKEMIEATSNLLVVVDRGTDLTVRTACKGGSYFSLDLCSGPYDN